MEVPDVALDVHHGAAAGEHGGGAAVFMLTGSPLPGGYDAFRQRLLQVPCCGLVALDSRRPQRQVPPRDVTSLFPHMCVCVVLMLPFDLLIHTF
jgi:hypothetical protein